MLGWHTMCGYPHIANGRTGRPIADIRLTLRGRTHSWTYFFLHTMEQLGVVSGQWRAPGAMVEDVMALTLDSEVITSKLTGVLTGRWKAVLHRTNPGTHEPTDPRTAPSDSIYVHTHGQWVYILDTTVQRYYRKNAPKET